MELNSTDEVSNSNENVSTNLEEEPQKKTKEKKHDTKRVIDQIGDRMKAYEKKASMKLDPTLPMIARIDGHKFSMFTKGFKRPFDERIHNAMRSTMADLLEKFNSVFGYTQSDEITLVFAPCTENQSMLFDGKVVKISSLLAAYATVRFNFHLMKSTFESPKEDKLRSKVDRMDAHFDGRVFNVPTTGEALNNVLWRCAFDCRRNSISALGFTLYNQKELQGIGSTKLQEKMKIEKNVDWENMPDEFKYGSMCKRETFEKECEDPITKQMMKVQRSRVVTKSLKLEGFNEQNINLIMAKYW